MTTSIDNTAVCFLPTLPISPPTSQKRKRTESHVDDGFATPPASPRSTTDSRSRQRLQVKREEDSLLLPTPPNSVHASPEPTSTAEPFTALLALIQRLQNGGTHAEAEISLSIAADELERFEKAVGKDRSLSRFLRRKLRHEWDPRQSIFTILKVDREIEEVQARISQCLETRFREMGDAEYMFGGLDSWEHERVKELVDLIRPLPRRERLDIGIARMNPDLSFSFGTVGSVLGMAQKHVEPLVVFEVRCVGSRQDMEDRARRYFETLGRKKCPFRHHIKTVVLVYYVKDGTEVQISLTRLGQEGVITTTSVDSGCGHIHLTLSDFLPRDAIELGFARDKRGRRACDDVEICIDIDELKRSGSCLATME